MNETQVISMYIMYYIIQTDKQDDHDYDNHGDHDDHLNHDDHLVLDDYQDYDDLGDHDSKRATRQYGGSLVDRSNL